MDLFGGVRLALSITPTFMGFGPGWRAAPLLCAAKDCTPNTKEAKRRKREKEKLRKRQRQAQGRGGAWRGKAGQGRDQERIPQ